MLIRAGRPADAEAVNALLEAVWRSTYTSLIGLERVQALHDRWHSAQELARQIERAENTFLVAEDGNGAIVGHALGVAGPQRLAILRLYVADAAQGNGLGRDLLDVLIATRPTLSIARLYVFAGNTRAISFYEREGFAVAGHVVEDGIVSLRMDRERGPG